jgi:hypothetical protein
MWFETEDYMVYEPRNKTKLDLYMIDIDGTIVESKSGTMPFEITDPDDWIFIGQVPEKLEQLSGQIVLFANITNGKEELSRQKLDRIRQAIDLDLWIFGLKSEKWKKPYINFLEVINVNFNNITLIGNCDSEWANSDLVMYEKLKLKNPTCTFIKGTDIFNTSLPRKPEDKEVIILLGLNRTKIINHFESMGYSILKEIPKRYNKYIVIDNPHPTYNDRKKIIDSIPKNFNYRIVWCINNSSDNTNLSQLERNNYIEHFECPTRSEGIIRKVY